MMKTTTTTTRTTKTVMKRWLAIAWMVTACVISSLTVGSAHAQPSVSADLKKRGDQLFDQSKFAEAYDYYEKAYAAHPDPALLYNQGRALESMGEYPEAIGKLEYFKTEAPPALVAKVQVDALLAEMRARLATLTIRSNVDNAELLLRGKSLGPMERKRIVSTRAGTAEIELRAPGFDTMKRTVDLPRGAALDVEMNLTPTAKQGVIAIASNPTGSDVIVDDRPLGISPLETKVPAGQHTIVLRHEGYDEQRVGVTVGINERRDVNVDLPEKRSVFGRWYFWAGIGVLATGGIIAAAALIDKPAEKGSFTPDQTRAPLMISF
jgi:hypothetical protein